MSDDRFKRLNITDVRELVGYTPQDGFTAENPALKGLWLNEVVRLSSQSSGQESGIRDEL